MPPLARPRLFAAMREADVVLNTSLGEGMCGALLEAMSLGTPVVARRNPGNAALVEDGRTGLLYDEPGDLVRACAALRGPSELARRLTVTARAKVAQDHGLRAERRAYRALAGSLVDGARRSA